MQSSPGAAASNTPSNLMSAWCLPVGVGSIMGAFPQILFLLMVMQRQVRVLQQTPESDEFLLARQGAWEDRAGGFHALRLYPLLGMRWASKATRRRAGTVT